MYPIFDKYLFYEKTCSNYFLNALTDRYPDNYHTKYPQLNQLLLNGNELHCMEDAVHHLVKSCVEYFQRQKVNIQISLDSLENPEGFRNKLDSMCVGSPVSISCTKVTKSDGNSLTVTYSRTMKILVHPGLNIIPPPDDAPGPAENIVFYLGVETNEDKT